MSAAAPPRELLARARDDLATFADLAGWPLTSWQAESLRLPTRTTAIVAPRQTGKSQSLAVLACHRAFARPGQRVLVVSAGEDAARRLLATVRQVALSPLLAGSVIDEGAALLVLSNGSEVRSVPASERQVRGWTVDLLIIDEAALVGDDLILGAALPTTAARPEARIVLASSPWGPSGAFHRSAIAGADPANPHTRTHRWRVQDAPWITPAVIEHARATLPPPRFRAEFLAEFVGASDLYFDREEVLGALAPYELLDAGAAAGEAIAVGLDWGRAQDAHAIACVGVLDDHDLNAEPLLFIPWLEASRRPYAEQVAEVARLARPAPTGSASWWRRKPSQPAERFPGGTFHHNGATLPSPGSSPRGGYEVVAVLSEANGVGAMPSEEVAGRLRGSRVEAIHTSQATKEDAYGRIRALLGAGRLVLPDHEALVRQLLAVTYAPTPSGGLTIGAAGPGADDLTDALSLALAAVGAERLTPGRATRAPDELDVLYTGSGLAVPIDARPRRDALTRGRGFTITRGGQVIASSHPTD